MNTLAGHYAVARACRPPQAPEPGVPLGVLQDARIKLNLVTPRSTPCLHNRQDQNAWFLALVRVMVGQGSGIVA
jgi:hypothetical protein